MSEGLGLSGSKSTLNISGTPQLVSNTTTSSYSERRIARVNVLVAGTAPGSVNDAATVALAALANQVFVVPNVAGTYYLDFPMLSGIVITPGTGQTVAVSYD